MKKDTPTEVRRKLKQQLYRERTVWTKDGYQPLCAICGEPPRKGMALQMHEAFITRGDVRGNKELGYDIMSRYNCVLVHADCHEHANSEENLRKCALNILEHEGYKNTRKWLNCMDARMLTNTAKVAKRILFEVSREPIKTHDQLDERIPMDCKVCGKDVFKHTKKDVEDCLKEAGVSTRGQNPIGLLSQLKVKVSFNRKSGWIKYDKGVINNSKDLDLDLLRLSLTGDEVKAPKKIEKKEKVDDTGE